ncbi:MAG: mannose-6-phosphate isomerase [Cyclobacteriaceae bacterium]
MALYPLKFSTIFKDKIWGGHKIKDVLGKDFSPLPNCGETWELSGVAGNISKVANGELKGKSLKELIQTYKSDLVGEKAYTQFGLDFPLLIKFIDANQDLSIQVHPDDKLAKERHDSFGKTEMWYVIQADEGSSLISGFNQELDKEKYLEYFNAGKLDEILNREEVAAGDVFFLPAGRVHTIGKGLMIAEIQQTSDITYRIYDFDRVDAQGNKRELHVEEALDAIDFKKYDHYKSQYSTTLNERSLVESCEFFTTNMIKTNEAFSVDLPDLDCFKIYICTAGSGHLIYDGGSIDLKFGEVILVPASMKKYKFETTETIALLESYI